MRQGRSRTTNAIRSTTGWRGRDQVKGVVALERTYPEHAGHGRPRAALWPSLRAGHLDGRFRPVAASLHVDASAHAALLALTRGEAGIYNIAEDDGAVSIAKARRELGFDPGFRIEP